MKYFFTTLTFLIFMFTQAQGLPENVNKFKLGDKAPSFSGKDQYGNSIVSDSILKKDKIVLLFYRGSWCGYCMKHLKEVQSHLNKIESKKGKVIVVTSEAPYSVDKTISNTGAKFSIISDTSNTILDQFGVSYVASESTVPKYTEIVINKTKKANNDEIPVLPITSAYVIDNSGTFGYIYFNSDYTQRASIEEILEVLEK